MILQQLISTVHKFIQNYTAWIIVGVISTVVGGLVLGAIIHDSRNVDRKTAVEPELTSPAAERTDPARHISQASREIRAINERYEHERLERVQRWVSYQDEYQSEQLNANFYEAVAQYYGLDGRLAAPDHVITELSRYRYILWNAEILIRDVTSDGNYYTLVLKPQQIDRSGCSECDGECNHCGSFVVAHAPITMSIFQRLQVGSVFHFTSEQVPWGSELDEDMEGARSGRFYNDVHIHIISASVRCEEHYPWHYTQISSGEWTSNGNDRGDPIARCF